MQECLFEEAAGWQSWVTPGPLENKPVHRWYVFPHSFTSDLVQTLIHDWGLQASDKILDPFLGAGTTVLAAKECGIPATGYDLSPLAVFAAGVKIRSYDRQQLVRAWDRLQARLVTLRTLKSVKTYSSLVKRALPGKILAGLEDIDRKIGRLRISTSERAFFRLALLNTIPQFSRAIASGGWLKWTANTRTVRSLSSAFQEHIESMLADLGTVQPLQDHAWSSRQGDARKLPEENGAYTALITSPPYPNRHDYTRVFGIELMFGFLDWEETRALRYQTFHSHPEARPKRPSIAEYRQPALLNRTLQLIQSKVNDRRIPKMIEGYFTDMYVCLAEARRVCREGARMAFVVGNVQYGGYPVLVDELTGEIGEQVGLVCEKISVARRRGNSAQQMGEFGRTPSRESVVIFRR